MKKQHSIPFKIVVTGAESSGKTTLAQMLEQALHAPLRTEYARQYFADKGNAHYDLSDILSIAQQQFVQDQVLSTTKNSFLILDTDLITEKIWSEYKFQTCDAWILEKIEAQPNDLYLLCSPEGIVWEYDELRENENDRDALFELYQQNLIAYQRHFIVLHGSPETRLQMVLHHLQTLHL